MDYIETLRQYVGERPIIAPGSAVIILNDSKELLLQLREDTNDWGLPGGGMELGDSFEETAQKELHEETGLNAEELKLIGIASGKETYYKYPNGDEIYNATAIYEAVKIKGKLKEKDETKDLQYFPLDNLPQLNYISKIFHKKVGYIS